MSFRDKLDNTDRPHKLLALDGGGIRGIITIEILSRMEGLLQDALGLDDKFVLADYFDYIAGTSTGAIIAACLSLGMRVERIRNFYLHKGEDIFQRAPLWNWFHYRFKHKKLEYLLKEEFGEEKPGEHTKFGSDRLKTLLMVVLRNNSSDSPWPLSNNPNAKYNKPEREDCNLTIPLWQLVRASTAAPTYFQSERINVGKTPFDFMDGGVTMYNNPAFQLFLMATIEPYNLCWPVGEANMLMISIGTGTSPSVKAKMSTNQMHLLFNAKSIPAALMYAALNEQDLLCRVFGKCLFGARIDRELENLIGNKRPLQPKLFTYVRYNADLSQTGLEALGLYDIEPKDVQRLDSVRHTNDLQRIGEKTAKQVDRSHFAAFL